MLDLGVIDLLVPVLVLILAILYLPVTLIAILVNGKFTEFVSWKSFQQAWFSRFWHFFGWASRPLFAPDVEKVLAAANGVVLDIGTGSGDWLYLFTETRNKKISKLCLVEPNSDFHPVVQRRVRELGLAEKCQIISGVDLLERCGVQPGTVDTVSTVHVLCSVETPGPLAKTLYHYLKPGGQWLVYEHVKARNGWKVAAAWQEAGINTIWPFFLDGCSMTRNTEGLLTHVGEWTSVELGPGTKEGRFNLLPHIKGVLVK